MCLPGLYSAVPMSLLCTDLTDTIVPGGCWWLVLERLPNIPAITEELLFENIQNIVLAIFLQKFPFLGKKNFYLNKMINMLFRD